MWKQDDGYEYIEPGQPQALDEEKEPETDDKPDKKQKLIAVGLPLILSLLFFIVPLFFKIPVYALNDDIQIRDILSGAYSGSPDFHTVYMGALLSGILAFLYAILPFIPWYGLFLCAAPAAVFLILGLRIMGCRKHMLIRILGLAMLTGLYLWFLYPMYLMPHYTLVAAVFAAGGLWLMMDREMTGGLVLLLLCQQTRQQVFLMLLPFAAAVFLLIFLEDKDKREDLKKPLLIFAASLMVLLAVNAIAYADGGWWEYLKLNDARTQLYDYTGVWESRAAKDHYAQSGVTSGDYPLYLSYDLLPVKGADTATLNAMADYTEEGRQLVGMERFKEVLRQLEHIYLLDRNKARVYAFGLFIMYALVAGRSLYRGKGWGALFGLGCLLLNFLIHGYLLWKGRIPERISASLSMAQCFMLGGMVLRYAEELKQVYWAIEGAVLTFAVSQAFSAVSGLQEGYAEQITVNNEDDVLYSYMAENPDELFVMETYATVYHTAYIYKTDKTGNTMLMGGWQYLSPLQDKKLKAFGYNDRFELFSKSGTKLVFRKGDGLAASDMEAYLNEVYGTGIKLIKELPGDFEIYVVE